jgi:hypothetical protein
MGFTIVSSNGESATYSGCCVTLIPFTLLDEFYHLLETRRLRQVLVTLSPAWRNDLLETYPDNDLPIEEFEALPDNLLVSTILEHQDILNQLEAQRQVYPDMTQYDLPQVEQILSRISHVIYALQLGGLFTGLTLVHRFNWGNNVISNLECQELVVTLELLLQLNASDDPTMDHTISERLVQVFRETIRTPDGFVTMG